MTPELLQKPEDPEKNAPPNVKNSSWFTRGFSRLFRRQNGELPTPNQEEEYNPANENLFSRQFRDIDESTYAAAESRQTSAKLWSIYVDEAERYDTTLVESWKADMEGMLIFSGLFSASLTAFLIESYKTLQLDSGDRTVQILSQISQQLGAMSINASFPFAPADESPLKPALSSLVCNTLWFLSLCLSIMCALLATLVEQWSREFLHRTERRPSPLRRARIISFLYFGVRRFHMHGVVDLIPLLLHVSLVFFLAGLVAFLLPINHMMTGLITGVLAIFLMLYSVLTIFPAISIDCPYRTPFSPFAWSLIRCLPTKFKLWAPSHSATANIHDVMANDTLEEALKDPEPRDQRALRWTLESLTDDHELLPFLEAIPDAIVGRKGFHLINDYLFIPLLTGSPNHSSLVGRITDMLFSCRNMVPADPQRQLGLIGGMKALWALGMISGRTGKLFDHGGQRWFDSRTRDALEKPLKESWPDAYAISARTAIVYAAMNNLRNAITSLSQRAQEHPAAVETVLAGVQRILELRKISTWVFSGALQTHLDSLEAWSNLNDRMDKMANIKMLLRDMAKPEIWLEASVTLVYRFLVHAARNIYDGGGLPYEYLQTCLKIVPMIPSYNKAEAPQMAREHVLAQRDELIFKPCHYEMIPGEIDDLDWIMRCLLRIIPHLRPQDAVPRVVSYLANRNDPDALDFAFRECDLEHLIHCLVVMLKKGDSEIPLLEAILVVLVSDRYLLCSNDWNVQDEDLWDYITKHNIISASSPLFRSLSDVMILRKHLQIRFSAVVLVKPGRFEPKLYQQEPLNIRQVRSLAAESSLPGEPYAGILPDDSPQALFTDITRRAKQCQVRTVTDYLGACAQSTKPAHMSGTVKALCRLLPETFEEVPIEVMAAFAQAWVTLIEHLMDNPDNGELHSTVNNLIFGDGDPVHAYYHPRTAHIFKKALELYLKVRLDRQMSVTRAQQAVDEITRRLDHGNTQLSVTVCRS